MTALKPGPRSSLPGSNGPPRRQGRLRVGYPADRAAVRSRYPQPQPRLHSGGDALRSLVAARSVIDPKHDLEALQHRASEGFHEPRNRHQAGEDRISYSPWTSRGHCHTLPGNSAPRVLRARLCVVRAAENCRLWPTLVSGLLQDRRHRRVRHEALPPLRIPVE